MSFTDNALLTASYIGDDIGALQGGLEALTVRVGDNAALNTTQKATIVAAINELNTGLGTLGNTVANLPAPESEIDDTHTGSVKGWSASKIATHVTDSVNALKQSLLGGVGADADTFSELLSLITNNQDALTAINNLTGSFVSFQTNQTLTAEQKTRALNNIGAAAQSAVTALQQFVADFGDVAVDLVGRYEARRMAAGGPSIVR